MAYTTTWNAAYELVPAAGDNVSDGAEVIRVLKVAIQERMKTGHIWKIGDTDGMHILSDFQANMYAADAGASDTYVVTLSPVPAAYFAGMIVSFKANTVNTGACTLNVNSLGAKSIKKQYNVDPGNGDIKASQVNVVIYDGTNFQLVSPQSGLTLTPATTGFTITGGTTPKTLTVSESADTKNIIAGDGTAGRVLRSFVLRFYPGSTPNTNINISDASTTYSAFNSPTIVTATDLAAGGSSGSFALNAAGTIITMDITPAFIGVLSVNIISQKINSAGTVPHYISAVISGGNLTLYITAESSVAYYDWRTVLDANDNCYFRFSVVTDS